MDKNQNNEEDRDNGSDRGNKKVLNTEGDAENKSIGQDDDENIQPKPVKPAHEYINPTAEEDGTIEDERSGIKASGNTEDEKNPGNDRNPATDQKTDEVNMNRERNDQNINHDRKIVDATEIHEENSKDPKEERK